MLLTIEKEVESKTTLLNIKGVVDMATTHIFDLCLDEIRNANIVIIDFFELKSIDSTGVGAIINVICASRGKKFKLKL